MEDGGRFGFLGWDSLLWEVGSYERPVDDYMEVHTLAIYIEELEDI